MRRASGLQAGHRTARVEEDAARPGRIRQWGKLRDVKRPACFSVADGRVAKLRDGCVSAMPQACGTGRGDRRTPTDC